MSAIGDLEGYSLAEIDVKLAELFDGENTHNNDGTHLDIELVDDKVFQDRYKSLISCLLRLYGFPSGPIG